MYHFKILKREGAKLLIEAKEASLTEITGLFTFD